MPFHEHSDAYYAKKEEQEKRRFNRQIIVNCTTRVQDNHLPSKAVKKRMDSEHLNAWLKRGEIQEAAERFKEYRDMLKRMSPDQIQKLR